MSNSLQPHGLQPTRLLCPRDSPGKNTGVGCHVFLQGIFPTQGLNPGLLHCRWILYRLSYQGSPIYKHTHTHRYVHKHTCMHTHTNTCVYTCTHEYTCIYTCVDTIYSQTQHTHACTCVHRCIYTCMNLYTYACAHMNMSLSKLQEIVKDRGPWHATAHGVTESGVT